MEEVIQKPATTDQILLRILRNLDEAFERNDDQPKRQVMRTLAVKLMEDE